MNIAKEIIDAFTQDDVTPDVELDGDTYSIEWTFGNGARLFIDISGDGIIQVVWKNKKRFYQGVINTVEDDKTT